MVKYTLYYTLAARKDVKRYSNDSLKKKAKRLLNLIEQDPFVPYPPYETLRGDLKGYYSRRINIQHRLVYKVIQEKRLIKVIRLWTHYE